MQISQNITKKFQFENGGSEECQYFSPLEKSRGYKTSPQTYRNQSRGNNIERHKSRRVEVHSRPNQRSVIYQKRPTSVNELTSLESSSIGTEHSRMDSISMHRNISRQTIFSRLDGKVNERLVTTHGESGSSRSEPNRYVQTSVQNRFRVLQEQDKYQGQYSDIGEDGREFNIKKKFGASRSDGDFKPEQTRYTRAAVMGPSSHQQDLRASLSRNFRELDKQTRFHHRERGQAASVSRRQPSYQPRDSRPNHRISDRLDFGNYAAGSS